MMSAAEAPADTVAALEEGRHPVCVLEIGGAGGVAPIVQAIRSQYPRTMIIAIADPDDPEATAETLRAGVFDVLSRPVEAAEFAALVANAHEHLAFIATQNDVPAVESAPYGVFGVSNAMRDVMRTVQRAAPSRCGVMVCGERGTGREMVARAIHAHGHRPQAPFVKVDCVLPTPQDVEQELFGVRPARRGDADPARRHLEQLTPSGRIYQAIGGTLFLENIASMPDRVQARLVRLLRDREATIPDRRDPIDVDVRPIAALEPAPARVVDDDRLRPDLLEQLSVVRIDLPALRHRREDIPLLAIHFLKQICQANGSPPKTLSRAALALLGALSWRGNARELRALVERLVLLVPHGVVRIEDILAHVRLDTSLAPIGAAATLREARLQFEREYIQGVLQQHHGRMGDAARVLGIQRTNLYRKVRSLNLGGAQRRQRRG
jgi:DNA-binding NtrC family response regulator